MTAPVQVQAWGRTGMLSSGVIRFADLPTAVCADGANGLTVVSAAEAAARGICVPPGDTEVPLVAYHPADKGERKDWLPAGRLPMGLDNPDNLAGHELWIQGRTRPAPGAYWSFTALQNHAYAELDARRYFDSAAMPGFVLPGKLLPGVELGDLAIVTHTDKHGVPRKVMCQAYDIGPGHKFEISIEGCRQLGIADCARNGGAAGGTDVAIYVGSHAWTSGGKPPVPWTANNVAVMAEQARKYLEAMP